MADKKPDFGVICQHKDTNPSNLTDVFDSYGCNMLEAKVAVVEEPIAEELCNIGGDQQLYGTLALKTESTNRALSGRGSRTRDRSLKVVQVAGETILVAGPIRERSPVDGDELDEELDEYMKEASRIRELKKSGEAIKENSSFSFKLPPELMPNKKTYAKIVEGNEKMDDDLNEELDEELNEYMQEAARKRAQKKKIEEQTDRALAMSAMEQELDYDDL